MALPRPKILSVITVPTGGWAWDIDLSDVAQFDTNITGTVPAGDYFMSADQQSDDFLFALMTSIMTARAATAVSGIVLIGLNATSHKVQWKFVEGDFASAPGRDVRLNFTAWDSDLCKALGVDNTADVSLTGTNRPEYTSDWHHGYGWYADEDGQINDIGPADSPMSASVQGVAPYTGHVKSIYYGERYANQIQLQFLERYDQDRTKVWSDGKAYGDAPVWPYNRNEPLECWWHEAKYGRRFRVYRDGHIDTNKAADYGVSTASNNTTLTDANKSWSVEPYRWVGRLIYIDPYTGSGIPQWFYIISHTSTVLTANDHPGWFDVDGNDGGAASHAYYLFDHPYQTYVADLNKMTDFSPKERRVIDRWDISIPLLRYES